MNQEQLLLALRVHFAKRSKLRESEDGQAWLAQLLALVRDASPDRVNELQVLTQKLGLPVSRGLLEAHWRQIQQLAQDVIARLEHASNQARPDEQGPYAVPPDSQIVLDLVADFLFVDGNRLPRGLDVRLRMGGDDRERKRARLQALVPTYLSLHGTPRDDSYLLTPVGALQCKHSQVVQDLATQLLNFAREAFGSARKSFTWEQLQQTVRREGHALTDEDLVAVDFVLFCLGVWSRSGRSWTEPPPEQLEDLLEAGRDPKWIFLRVHEEILRQHREVQDRDHSRGFNFEARARNASSSVQQTDDGAEILLVTATPTETQAVLSEFAWSADEGKPRGVDGRVYFDLGVVNGARVKLTQSEMGTGGLGASSQTVAKGIEAVSPAIVIMVGIAFGVDEASQDIGAILISEQLRPYELQRLGTTPSGDPSIVLRGDRPHASPWLVNLFKSSAFTWQKSELRFGLILTGEKLVDNLAFREKLRAAEPQAIGGEMEGAGLYVACQDRKVDWILVKAICDFADGQKGNDKQQRQGLAASRAAAFVRHALEFADVADWRRGEAKGSRDGAGGKGGNARVGGNGVAIAGRGGGAGPIGAAAGGNGGSAEVSGDGVAFGGEGGEAGQLDRGGRGGRSLLEVHGFSALHLLDRNGLSNYGRGSDGGVSVDRVEFGWIALGPSVIAEGQVVEAGAGEWTLQLRQPFKLGDIAALRHFSDDFDSFPSRERYVSVERDGDARLLASAPRITQERDQVLVRFAVQPPLPRQNIEDQGPDMAIDLEQVPPDLKLDGEVRGRDCARQRMAALLGRCKDGWGIECEFGSRIAELHEKFGGEHDARVVALELARLSAVPFHDAFTRREEVMFDFLKRVVAVKLLPPPAADWIAVEVTLDCEGLRENWTTRIPICIDTMHLGPKPDFFDVRP